MASSSSQRSVQHCGICNEEGHNKRSCPQRNVHTNVQVTDARQTRQRSLRNNIQCNDNIGSAMVCEYMLWFQIQQCTFHMYVINITTDCVVIWNTVHSDDRILRLNNVAICSTSWITLTPLWNSINYFHAYHTIWCLFIITCYHCLVVYANGKHSNTGTNYIIIIYTYINIASTMQLQQNNKSYRYF